MFKSNDFKKQTICIRKINNLNCSTEEIVKIENYAKYMSFKKNKQCGKEIKKLLCNGLCSFDKNLFSDKSTSSEDSSKILIIIAIVTINISLTTCLNLFVYCESKDYSKADNLILLNYAKFYCENEIRLPMETKLKIDEKSPYYTNFNNFLLNSNTLHSAKNYSDEIKRRKIMSDIIEKNFMKGYQFLLKNYNTLSENSVFFKKYKNL